MRGVTLIFLFSSFQRYLGDSTDDISNHLTRSHSYYDRLEKSKSDVIIGLILLIFLPWFLWNIERSVVRYQMLIKQCQFLTYEVKNSEFVNETLEGRPILVKGLTAIDETFGVVRDLELNYQPHYNVIRLKRIVEMFQWVEQVQESDDETSYSYEKGWHEHDVDSGGFQDSSSHYNPSRQPSIYSSVINAEAVYVGAYQLSSQQVERLHDWQACPIPAIPGSAYTNYHHLFPRIERSSTMLLTSKSSSSQNSSHQEGYVDYLLFNGGTLHSPDIGTVRVSYQCVYAANPITTVGVQTQNSFRPFYFSDSARHTPSLCPSSSISSSSSHGYASLDDGEDYSSSCCVCFDFLNLFSFFLSSELIGSEVLLVEERITNLQTLFRDEKRSLFWRITLLRLVSYLLLSLGIFLILKPIATLLSFIPVLGSLISTTLWIAALVIGFLGGIVISSCAWVAYRPSVLAGNLSFLISPPSLSLFRFSSLPLSS
jgi:hypothetical protein